MEPPPPIPDELRDRDEVYYGFEISDELVAAYRAKHDPRAVAEMPNTEAAVYIYKFNLLKQFAQDLRMDFITLFAEKARFHNQPWRARKEDMVFWALGLRGKCITETCPNTEKLKEYIRKLGIDVEPAWYP